MIEGDEIDEALFDIAFCSLIVTQDMGHLAQIAKNLPQAQVMVDTPKIRDGFSLEPHRLPISAQNTKDQTQ